MDKDRAIQLANRMVMFGLQTRVVCNTEDDKYYYYIEVHGTTGE